ncbi:Phosphotransferase enzyme family protein [Colletotrichum higginsianum IMI 349063]|uniref:Phosphotransferase enzyme family protein n=1 Tax=Colletotrichum higginsianum (strain IMI 349063) TaxID=759273 RepID=A0A1B7YHL0_COLHI|nr:Phosphotransferase enzyme family protein [Colletotrichum higginsianum IMI 349063]OBR11546.1 Phosphotransferase enzyme family protein [Colletotrichum higginsianum IMI 349063]
MARENVTRAPRRWSVLEDYIHQLTPYDKFVSSIGKNGRPAKFETVDMADLTTIGSLPGKTGARVVTRRSSGICPTSRFVFKGIDFESYKRDGRDFREHQEKTLLHEIRTLHALPPHPNIMPCPRTLVVVQDCDNKHRICGFLQPAMEKDSVDEQIMRANRAGRRLPAKLKAKWCYQMALAIQHTHQVAESFHMDLKPGNILVDDENNLRLIDWEQSGFSMFTHPPEITVDQEAEEESRPGTAVDGSGCGSGGGRPRIIYTPHVGGPRRNQKWGFPDWNVLPEWKTTCPRAAELAEVFSLGRTMWMLLEQVEQSADRARWTAAARDVPEEWKNMVMRCIERDPNNRPELDEVVAFWRRQV